MDHMNHSSNNYNFNSNFLLPNRPVLVKGTPQNDFHTGNFFKKHKNGNESSSDNQRNDVEEAEPGTEKNLLDLKTNVEGGKGNAEEGRGNVEKSNKKIIITETVRNRFKNEMGKDIYGGDNELREKYREGVSKAIEKLGKGSLADFIKNHTPGPNIDGMNKSQLKNHINNNGSLKAELAGDDIETMDKGKLYDFIKQHSDSYYNKGDYAQWNQDFANLVTPNMPKEYANFKTSDSEVEGRYLVGGLQQYLLDEFDTDVFQATVSHPNPFINVDGRLGVYTISVMAAHWNGEFQAKDAKNRSKLAYGALGDDYSERNEIMYENALTHLNTQLTIASLPANTNTKTRLAEVKKGVGTKVKLAKNSIRNAITQDSATKEALFAFDSAYDKQFSKEIKDMILNTEDGFDNKSAEEWQLVHNDLIDRDSDYFSQGYADKYEGHETLDLGEILAPVLASVMPDKSVESRSTKKEVVETVNKGLLKEDFIRGLRARLNRGDFDFNLWISDEDKHREEFANKIYDVCDKYKIPLTTVLLDDVIENLKVYSSDGKSVDYGRKLFKLTDTQTAAQKTENRRLISYLGRGLREKYLNEELPEENDEIMTKDDFIAEMITELDSRDVDFQSWGFEYNAREAFAKDSYKKCEALKKPTSMNTVHSMVEKLIYEYMVADNDIEYHGDTTDSTEIASNDKILDKITEGIA